MKDIDINLLISAYYDNELTESELDYLLEETKKDPELLAKLNNYALISAISEMITRLSRFLKTFQILFKKDGLVTVSLQQQQFFSQLCS